MSTQLHCRSDERGRLVRRSKINGIDHLEVLASQRTLLVHCFHSVADQGLDADNAIVEGGERIRDVAVEWAGAAAASAARLRADERAYVEGLPAAVLDRALLVRTDRSGDFSTYTLHLVASRALPDRPPDDFDLVRSSVAFSFKVDCPSEFDCAQDEQCEPPLLPEPQIDYMAKDYASFRRLLLDRLAVVMPRWRDRNPADVEVTVVELLAYAADRLSYHQDAAATEAYLGTARRRASVRRHARLLDYRVHDGVNARAWACFEIGDPNDDGARLEAGTPVLTGEPGAEPRLDPDAVAEAVSRGALVFETLEPLVLQYDRNTIDLYAYGETDCCLPRGATRATLVRKGKLQLAEGDVLLLEEVRGPKPDEPPEPGHRHAVRLSRPPVPRRDEVREKDLLEIEWHDADALPFALCLRQHPDGPTARVRGNVALCDHGHRIPEPENLPEVPKGRRYRPPLDRAGLTYAAPYDARAARRRPASEATRVDARDALPWIRLVGEGELWEPEADLLGSERFATAFVVEMGEDGRAELRFGDDVQGRAPRAGTQFRATYRVGSGGRGNIGAGALSRVATAAKVTRVTNPIPATGGTDPEPLEQARLLAPQAFRSQRRAVTLDDYARAAEAHPQVQRAGATRRWTGSWWTIFVTVDRIGGRPIDPAFEADLRRFLDPVRLAGHDLEIDGPAFVPLELILRICVTPGYVRSDLKEALLEVLGSGRRRDGRPALFHPDNFTFGATVYLSPIVAAVMAAPGVAFVEPIAFQPWRRTAPEGIADGRLTFGRLEIPTLENDPNRPESGRLELRMEGGL